MALSGRRSMRDQVIRLVCLGLCLSTCSERTWVKAQPADEVAPDSGVISLKCPGNSCTECVSNGCGWYPSLAATSSFDSCYESCSIIADIACYSILDRTNVTAAAAATVCDQVSRDLQDEQACRQFPTASTTSVIDQCRACTSTRHPSDNVTTCQWHPEWQSCNRNGVCNLLGCGISDCGTLESEAATPDTENGDNVVAPVVPTLAPVEVEVTPTLPPVVDVIPTMAPVEAINCDASTDCESCVSLGCGWASSFCLDSCDMIADIACYDTTTPTTETQSVCQVARTEQADREACFASTDCDSCISVELQTSASCRWYPPVGEFDGVCCTGLFCDFPGTGGLDTCPPPDTPPPPPSCDAAVSCQSCLDSSCAWAPVLGSCLTSCDAVADTACVDRVTNVDATSIDLCIRVNEQVVDESRCRDQTDCSTCTSTVHSDGTTTCQWFVGKGDDDEAYCGRNLGDGCNENGVCGTSTCPVEQPTSAPLTTAPPTKAPLTLAPPTNAPVALAPVRCREQTGCNACLEATCAWSNGACIQACSAFATTPCYSPQRFANLTTAAICNIEQGEVADATLCRSQSNCTACTSTPQTTKSENCQWYKPKNNFSRGYCGTGRCNERWECGSSTCPAPQKRTPSSTTLDVVSSTRTSWSLSWTSALVMILLSVSW